MKVSDDDYNNNNKRFNIASSPPRSRHDLIL